MISTDTEVMLDEIVLLRCGHGWFDQLVEQRTDDDSPGVHQGVVGLIWGKE